MDKSEKDLYLLMEIAEEQQQAVKAVLAGLEKSKKELTDAARILQAYGDQLLKSTKQSANEGATQGVKTALENVAKTATDAIAKASEPLLEKLAGVKTQAEAIEGKLTGLAKWFGWRFVGGVGAAAGVAILSVWIAVWWQRSRLDGLKAERDQITADMTAAQKTLAVLDKHLSGARYIEADDGRFIRVPGGALMKCIGEVPCIKLKD